MQHGKQLFGGTILCAGLMSGGAAAQDFSFSYTFASVGAYANYDGYTGPTFNYFAGAGPWSISVDDDGLGIATADSTGTNTSVTNTAYADANSAAYAFSFTSYLSVTADGMATASWDFNADAFAFSSFNLFNVTDGVFLFQESSGSGSMQVSLEAGKDYILDTFVYASSGVTGASHSSLVIPAPGAVGLLGCAGLLAARRRR